MQRNTNAIKQASNLFAFVMNNPTRWLDPWGLFAWNEADDHWFALRHEVENAGGSVSWNARTYTATASIFGVSVSFARGSDGVRITNNRMYVRADTFYSTVVNAAREMVFLGAHGGVARHNPVPHLHISMFISENSRYWSDSAFADNTRWGNVRFATISGGASRSIHVISVINSMNYLDRAGLRFVNHLYTGTGMITQLFEAHNHFMDNHSRSFNYALLPARRAPAFNSTSMVISLLNAIELDHRMTNSQRRFAIGIGSEIHPRNFGR